MIGIVLHQIENERAFTEAYVLVAHSCRSPAPAFPTAVRAANQSWISTGINMLHGDAAAPHAEMKVDEKIRPLGIAHESHASGVQSLFDCIFDFVAQEIVLGAGISRNRLTARDEIAGSHGTRIARTTPLCHGLPRPGSVFRNTQVRIASDAHVLIASGQPKRSRAGGCHDQSGSCAENFSELYQDCLRNRRTGYTDSRLLNPKPTE